MRILLIGSNGQLGKSIIKKQPHNIDLIKTSKDKLNLLDHKKCRSVIFDLKPDWVINCAAYTNVDRAENEKEKAIKINGDSLKFISEGLLETGGKLIHISTDYVFDGKSNIPYKPWVKTIPLNVYGYSKVIGERHVVNILGDINRGFIIRTSWLISPFSSNFVPKILKLLNTKNQIQVVNDQFSCPTSCKSLAELCWKFILYDSQNIKFLDDGQSIYHFCDDGITNWYEFSQTIRSYALELGLIKNPAIIKPISSVEYKSIANRPKYSLLECRETIDKFELKTIDWRINLRSLLSSISSESNNFTN